MSIINTERLVGRDVVTDLVKITYRLEAQAVATLDGRADQRRLDRAGNAPG